MLDSGIRERSSEGRGGRAAGDGGEGGRARGRGRLLQEEDGGTRRFTKTGMLIIIWSDKILKV